MKRPWLALVLLAACGDSTTDPDVWEWQLPEGFPAPRVPETNPMTPAKVALGRHLFYDTRLSGNRTQSCATCHVQARAFTDGQVTALGATGEPGVRNVPTIANAAWNATQGWANPQLATLEQQTLVPLFGEAPIELGLAGKDAEMLAALRSEPRYDALFADAFPDAAEPYTLEHVVQALTSFDRSVISGSSPYDRFTAGDRGALTAAQQRGLEVFNSERLQCHHCHAGFALTISYLAENTPDGGYVRFANDGLYSVDATGAYPAADRGVIDITGLERDMGRFRPPTLRNIAVTAPYMHDGSIATLGEVLDMYARGGQLIADGPNAGDGKLNPHKSALVGGFPLTADERADLLAFFEALTDQALLTNPAYSDPWQ